METIWERWPQENRQLNRKDQVFKNKTRSMKNKTWSFWYRWAQNSNNCFKTQSLKVKNQVLPFYNCLSEILGTCAQLKTGPRLDPCRARINLFELEHSINSKLQFFSDFSKGLKALLSQNMFFLHFGEWRQVVGSIKS